MNLNILIQNYVEDGYEYLDAEAQVCQDIILLKISNSRYKNNITIKGGVVMHSISNDKRRATRDLDLDFIKYSLKDESIFNFISSLNNIKDEIKIEIIGNIEELKQQNYFGKRVYVRLFDNYNHIIDTKLDIGVNKFYNIKQEDYCFNFNVINKSANLLINSKEQIFTEKLISLLKFGYRSTRYKDLFDFYYLITEGNMNKKILLKYIDILVLYDNSILEKNLIDIINRLKNTFNSKKYRNKLNNPKYNWLNVDIDTAINVVINYLISLEKIKVKITI